MIIYKKCFVFVIQKVVIPEAKVMELEIMKAGGYHDVFADQTVIIIPDYNPIRKILQVYTV